MDWEPNVIVLPKEWVLDLLAGTMSQDDFEGIVRAFVNGEQKPAPMRVDLDKLPPPTQELPKRADPTFIDWYQEQVKARFPNSTMPNRDVAARVFTAAEQEQELVADVLDIIEDVQTRVRVGSVSGLALKYLTSANGDFSGLRSEADNKRKKRAKTPNSFVDSVMQQAELAARKLPAKTVPNAVGVQRLKALTAAGKERGLVGNPA